MAKEGGLEEMIKDEFGLNEKQLKKVLRDLEKKEPKRSTIKKLPFNSERLKYAVLSDFHMGHKEYKPEILEHAIKYMTSQKVKFVCIPGDILEGMSGREGHVYELTHIGAKQQMDYAIEQLSKIKQPIYAITATGSHDGWYSTKNNMGYEVGPELERRLDNFTFLGYDEADLVTPQGLRIRLIHPGDATAYAISYKGQKYLNSISGGKKPHIVHQGHYHKAMYLFYRNVHFFDSGTLEGQTIFMKKKGTPAMLGYWIIDVIGDKKGVDRIRPEFIPFYE